MQERDSPEKIPDRTENNLLIVWEDLMKSKAGLYLTPLSLSSLSHVNFPVKGIAFRTFQSERFV